MAPKARSHWEAQPRQANQGWTHIGFQGHHLPKGLSCNVCQARKQVAGSHPAKNIMTTSRLLEMLHMDLFGPNHNKSLIGNSFGLVIVDDFSRFMWAFFLDDKAQVKRIFKTFTGKVQN
jgi:hypothetical protein